MRYIFRLLSSTNRRYEHESYPPPSVVRAAAICAAILLPGIALADQHDDSGLYIGAGGHVTSAELDYSKVFTSAQQITVTDSLQGVYVTGATTTAFTVSETYELVDAGDTTTVSLSADDDSDFGYGIHVGYKVNQFFAVEVGYAELGEFSGSASIEGITIDTGSGTATVSMGSRNSFVDVNAFSGAVLGSYPLADNVSVFGRLGYYATNIDESNTIQGTGRITADGDTTFSGTISTNKPLLEDASGLLYGAGLEVAFGRNRNFIMRGEFSILADGLGEVDDITQFGLTASYKF